MLQLQFITTGVYKDKDNNKRENAYCSNKECKFSIQKDNSIFVARTGKKMSAVQIKKIIQEKKIVVNCKSKTLVKYKGVFELIKNDKGYATLRFSFYNKK